MLAQEILKPVESLVARFEQIGRERIEGLPIYNPELQVEAVDFREAPDGLLGVLITPWFINVLLLPKDQSQWQSLELGTKHNCVLDNGEHEFVLGEDEQVGYYLFRTVISPTHCLKTQAAAQSTARQALYELLLPAEEKEQIDNTQQVELSAESKQNIGRRDFMRKLVPDI